MLRGKTGSASGTGRTGVLAYWRFVAACVLATTRLPGRLWQAGRPWKYQGNQVIFLGVVYRISCTVNPGHDAISDATTSIFDASNIKV